MQPAAEEAPRTAPRPSCRPPPRLASQPLHPHPRPHLQSEEEKEAEAKAAEEQKKIMEMMQKAREEAVRRSCCLCI